MAICALVGATDFNGNDFLKRYKSGEIAYTVAVDAGLTHLKHIGVVADMAVGDFDSLGYVPKGKNVFCYPTQKDKSDMELAVEHAVGRGFDTLLFYGALGGRLDHTLANLQLCARYSEENIDITGIGDSYAVKLLTGPDMISLPVLKSGTVSVFAANDVVRGVVERGMAYSFDDEILSNRTSRGLSNELTGKEATVAVQSGTLYVFYPLSC